MHSSQAEYNIRMWTGTDRMAPNPARVIAASPEQAFKMAIRDPLNNHYDKFGLIGRDGNIHTYDYRPGTPRKRPRVNPNAIALALQQAQEQAAAKRRASVVVTKEDPPPEPQGPVIASSRELADAIMKHVLPQMSPKRPFRADEIGPLLPVQYAPSWRKSPTVRSAVLVKLKERGVITKFSHFEYMRAAEYVDKKLIEEPPASPMSGNGHAAPAAAIALPPTPPPPVAASAPQQPFTPEEKLDAVLFMMRAIMSDDRQKKAKLDALAERIIQLMTDADAIRADLDAVIKSEQQAPLRFGELLDNLRRTPPLTPSPVTLSS
jgi:hypothetical protein